MKVGLDDIILNTFVFPEEELDEDSAYEIQGVRHVGFDLTQVLDDPASRAGASQPTSDPIVRKLIEEYGHQHDEKVKETGRPDSTIAVNAAELMDSLAAESAAEIERLFRAHNIEMPKEDGILADQAFIKLAISYATNADRADRMYSRPGACK